MVHKLYEHAVTFIQKLKLIQSQMVLKKESYINGEQKVPLTLGI